MHQNSPQQGNMSKLVLLALLGMVALAAAVEVETQKKVIMVLLSCNGLTGFVHEHTNWLHEHTNWTS